MASPPAFLSTLLFDVTRAESAETFVGWTGVAFFLGAGALTKELEAVDKSNVVSDPCNKELDSSHVPCMSPTNNRFWRKPVWSRRRVEEAWGASSS